LPVPPHRRHFLENSAPKWVDLSGSGEDEHYEVYPKTGSIVEWHKKHGIFIEKK
jgi:hypothetical protein